MPQKQLRERRMNRSEGEDRAFLLKRQKAIKGGVPNRHRCVSPEADSPSRRVIGECSREQSMPERGRQAGLAEEKQSSTESLGLGCTFSIIPF